MANTSQCVAQASAHLLKSIDELAQGLVGPVADLVPAKVAQVLVGRFCRCCQPPRSMQTFAQDGCQGEKDSAPSAAVETNYR